MCLQALLDIERIVRQSGALLSVITGDRPATLPKGASRGLFGAAAAPLPPPHSAAGGAGAKSA